MNDEREQSSSGYTWYNCRALEANGRKCEQRKMRHSSVKEEEWQRSSQHWSKDLEANNATTERYKLIVREN